MIRSTLSSIARRSNNISTSSLAKTVTSRFLSLTPIDDIAKYDVVPKADFGDFKEFSVIFTNRSLNLMSAPFQTVMKDLNMLLKGTYNAKKVALIPGSGTYGMEAVARQFATDDHVMVLRNGWFSYRWTEIFDMGGEGKSIPSSHTVLKAKPIESDSTNKQYAPYPIEEVEEIIRKERPAVFFAPHVETSTGIIIPDDYIKRVSKAMHEVGGLVVLDCIAAGTIWADMKELGVDVVISAPQKGWTGPACVGFVMMSEAAALKMAETQETSFSLSLKRWSAIMDTYENGGFGYHTTMPTDAIRDFHEISVETVKFGIPELKAAQYELGVQSRGLLNSRGLTSVAAPGFQAPGVLVYYSPTAVANPEMMNKFKTHGLQIAMGVPWEIDEPEGMKTFRLGLFGLDKLGNIPATISTMETALDGVLADVGHIVPQEAA